MSNERDTDLAHAARIESDSGMLYEAALTVMRMLGLSDRIQVSMLFTATDIKDASVYAGGLPIEEAHRLIGIIADTKKNADAAANSELQRIQKL